MHSECSRRTFVEPHTSPNFRFKTNTNICKIKNRLEIYILDVRANHSALTVFALGIYHIYRAEYPSNNALNWCVCVCVCVWERFLNLHKNTKRWCTISAWRKPSIYVFIHTDYYLFFAGDSRDFVHTHRLHPWARSLSCAQLYTRIHTHTQ